MLFYLASLILFFFSSRRRHTRYIGDWSSDVCSSDLAPVTAREYASSSSSSCGLGERGVVWGGMTVSSETSTGAARSEERRVGKESRVQSRAGTEKTEGE